jgi:signal transduction histidine kinase/ligand-binding sensor domain-containing protein
MPRPKKEYFIFNSRLVKIIVLVLLMHSPLTQTAAQQYRFDSWTTEDGLPQNSAFSIVQTPDGYLWFGTLAGLVRFDGIGFKVFDQSNTKELSSDAITAVYVDSEGTLWAATGGAYGASQKNNNLLSYKDGKFRSYTKEDGYSGENVRGFGGASDGGLWIATLGGLYKYTPGAGFHFYTTEDGLSNNRIWSVYESRDGNVWIGTSSGLNRFRDGKFSPVGGDGKSQNNVKSIRESDDGSIWCATQNGLIKITGESIATYTTADGLPENEISALAYDRDGNLWIGTVHGRLSRFRDGKFAESTSLGDLDVWSIYEDREGNIWAGVFSRGLYRIKNGTFRTFAQPEGLLADGTWGIYEDQVGDIWVATDVGLSEIKDGKVIKSYTQKDGLLDIIANSFFEDRENSFWIGSTRGITRVKNGKFDVFPFPVKREHWVSGFYEDANGILWIGTSHGLYQFKDGKFINPELNEKSRKFVINALVPGDGVMWLGTNLGLVEFRNDEFTVHSAPGQDSPDFVTSISVDDEGTLWLATSNRGALRFKDNNFTRYTVNEGLSDNILYHVLDDKRGNLWFGGNKGVFKVGKQELNDFDGKTTLLNPKVFDTSDGMRSRECNGNNSALRDRNGNLWFPTLKGAVEINPSSIEFNSIPPLVSIEQSIVDGAGFDKNAEIEPGNHKFEFHYAGLNLSAPRKVKFKYILEGYDQDWVDAGTRREAFYTNLPAGNYKFSVMAANNDGVWSAQETSINFLVREPFWRTSWFWLLSLAAISTIIFFAYRARISFYEKRQLQQETFARRLIDSQETERKRIAVELHDSLGQSLVLIKNWALIEIKSRTSGKSSNQNALQEITEMASDAINEVREIAYNLGPYQLEKLGLRKSIEEMIAKATASSGIDFTLSIDDTGEYLTKPSQVNVFRIVQEAVNNILKHSGARTAEISIKRFPAQIRLVIRDDGHGFAAKIPGDQSGTKGFGLLGMSERAHLLKAEYHIESQPGRGTVIFINLPYEQSPGKF